MLLSPEVTNDTGNAAADANLIGRVKEAVSVDLTLEAACLMRLLLAADLFPNGGLYSGPWAQLSVWRYSCHWLPLLLSIDEPSRRENLVPPVDVALVWLLHRTTDIHMYVEDCTSIAAIGCPEREPELLNVGSEQALAFSDGDGHVGAVSSLVWFAYSTADEGRTSGASSRASPSRGGPQEPYWPPRLKLHSSAYRGHSDDLLQTTTGAAWEEEMQSRLVAILPQAAWLLSRLMRAGFTGSRADLGLAVDRYCRFLLLAQRHQFETLLFPPDVLLVWWAHKAHSGAYLADMDLLMGCPFDPLMPSLDDPLLVRRTAQLYEMEFGLPYDLQYARSAAGVPMALAGSTSNLEELHTRLHPVLRCFDGAEKGDTDSRALLRTSWSLKGPDADGRTSNGKLSPAAVQYRSSGNAGMDLRLTPSGPPKTLRSTPEGRTPAPAPEGPLAKLLTRLPKLPWQRYDRGQSQSQSQSQQLSTASDGTSTRVVVLTPSSKNKTNNPNSANNTNASNTNTPQGVARPAGKGVSKSPRTQAPYGASGDTAPTATTVLPPLARVGPSPALDRTTPTGPQPNELAAQGGSGQASGAASAAATASASAMIGDGGTAGEPVVLPLCSEILALFNQTAASHLAGSAVGRHLVSTSGLPPPAPTTVAGAGDSGGGDGGQQRIPRAGGELRYVLWLLERELLAANAAAEAAQAAKGLRAGPRALARFLTRGTAGSSSTGSSAAAAAAAAASRSVVSEEAVGKVIAKAVARRAVGFKAFSNLPMRSDHPYWATSCPCAFRSRAAAPTAGVPGLQPAPSPSLEVVIWSRAWASTLAKAVANQSPTWVRTGSNKSTS